MVVKITDNRYRIDSIDHYYYERHRIGYKFIEYEHHIFIICQGVKFKETFESKEECLKQLSYLDELLNVEGLEETCEKEDVINQCFRDYANAKFAIIPPINMFDKD